MFSNGRDEPAAKSAEDHHDPRRRLPDEEQEEGREGKREVARAGNADGPDGIVEGGDEQTDHSGIDATK